MPLPYRVALCFLVLRLRHFRRCRQNTEGGTNALRDRQVVVQAAVSAAEHDWDVRGRDHRRDAAAATLIPGRHAVTVMIMAAALANGHARRRRTKREFSSVVENNSSSTEDTRDVATAVWFILARLVIVPVIAYPIFSVINLPGGRMTTLIILLELAMPGAQTVLVTLNAVGSGHVAEEIAPWYFLQYATAIITLTAFTVWALVFLAIWHRNY